MSTLGRDDILRLAALAADKGVETLESPVTGGVHLAAAGDITVLAGGDKTLFETHRPALEAMGGKIFHMGPLGSAAVIKVITNMLAFIHLVAAGEALMLAKRGGLDLAQAYHAIKASSGNSFVHETEGQLILNGSYNINFTMDLALKDLGFAARLRPRIRRAARSGRADPSRPSIGRRPSMAAAPGRTHGGEAAGGCAEDRSARARLSRRTQ